MKAGYREMFRSGSVARLRRALLTVALVAGFVVADAAAAPNATPKFTPRSAPAAPAIGAVHAGDEALTVVWAAPPGVADITAYDVRYVLTSADGTVDSNWTVQEDAWTGGPPHHVLTGLTNDAGYDVQVRAVTDTDGAWSATVAGTPAEFGGSRPTAAELPLDTPLGGVIGTSSDNDLFRLTLPRKAGLLLFTRGGLDTDGALYNSDGEALAVNDDEVELEELNFLIARILDAGTYYLDVEGWGRLTGPYTVYAEMIVDTTGIDDAQAVAVDGVRKGLIDKKGDTDYFQFTLDGETDVVLRSGPRVADTAAELLDGNGAPVTANDDGFVLGDPRRFLIRQKLPAGTYYVKVKPHLKDGTRHYSFHVETVTEPGSAIAEALPLAFGQLAAGRIDPSTDADYFRIDLAAATHVLARAVSNTVDIDGALLDGNGAAVGANVFEHTYGAEGPLGFMLSDRLAAGTHTLRVTRSAGDGVGGYAIRMLEDEAMNALVADCSALTAPFGDPLSGCQWHLKNTGQLGGASGEDIRVEDVWAGGNLGAGIGVAVVDSGLDEAHPDLAGNVDAARGHDYTDGDGLLYHGEERSGRRHAHGDPGGTAAAGVIAARDNGLGGRGVAPRATVYGYNLLRDRSAANEADAMSRGMATTAVSNNSWGPRDTPGLDPAPAAWEMAVDSGVTSGYGGKGVVYVWAAGNGGPLDESNFDGYANYYGVVAVCAVDHRGRRSTVSERGANLWVCAPSSDFYRGGPGILTTYDYGRYGNDFGGTSAAAPTVAGVVALVRAANPALTWRDVKLILAASARRNHGSDRDWRTGASKYGASGRYRFNRQYGFGVVDAKAAVDLADGWENLPPFIETEPVEVAPNLVVPDATVNVNGISSPGTTVESTVEIGTEVEFVEFVEVVTDFDARAFRDLEVELVSPSSTVSTLAVPYAGLGDDLRPFGIDPGFRFGSARHLGEDPAGPWTLRVTDHVDVDTATLNSWSLKIYGHRSTPGAPRVLAVTPGQNALTVYWQEPTNVGAAQVTSYDVRTIPSGAADKSDGRWAEATGVGTAASRRYTVSGLPDGAEYDVQVRGVNAQGAGAWSASVTGTTLANAAPEFSSPPAFGAAENQTLAGTVRASDSDAGDAVTGYAIAGGADAGFFSIGATNGALTFDVAPNFEDPKDTGANNTYVVEVQATSGTGPRRKTATQALTVAVADVGGEAPGKPAAPTVSPASATSLAVNWSAPANAGPAITDYDVQYRAGTSGDWTDAGHNGTAITATLTGLAEDTSHQVQVRATNGDGPGDWSDSGTGATGANAAPALDTAMVVEGNEVVLTYDRMLDGSSVPAPTDFEVVVEGAPTGGALSAGALRAKRYPASRGEPVSVVAVEVDGTEVRLTLDRPVAHGERVTVSYTPGTNPIRDTEGVAAPAIVDEVAVETLVSVMDAAVEEGGNVVFDVTLSRAVEEALTVAWTLADGTAVAGADYPAQSGSLTIPVDEDSGPVRVSTIDDSAAEGDETFTLTLTEPAGFPYWALLQDAMATGTIVDNDAPPNPGGGSGGGAANRPPVVEREIDDQALDVGEVLELDIRLNFYDRDQRALDYSVASADASVATVAVDRNGVLTIRGVSRGVTAITVTVADRRDERASDTFLVAVKGPALVALLPRASDPVREGFVRVINHDAEAGEVSIEAVDDTGVRRGPVALSVDAGATVHFNSGDLEDGNAAKGLPTGVGSGEGDWRLVLDSDLDFEVLSYIRAGDGFLTSMHDVAPMRDGRYRVAIFNPGSNPNQVSRLRLVNPGAEDAQVTITGIDDAGASPGTTVGFHLPAGRSTTLTATELESGVGVAGALGDGVGKWRLTVTSTGPIVAMSLLSSPTGHLTNLSTVPRTPDDEHGVHVVPLFPSASDPLGRQGFVRVVNRAEASGTVSIEAFDDSDLSYPPVTLALDAKQTRHFNSDDLELGNAEKGLAGSTGPGVGDWRLVLSSDLDIEVLAYIRAADGFLTSMHEVAPVLLGERRVAIFNPGSNPNQVSRLRLVNPGAEDAQVTITGIDDAGASPGAPVTVTVPAGASRTIEVADLEAGADGFAGALGDGVGKWRLAVTSAQPVIVMSLLSSPTGHLTNLSTAPDRGGN